MEIEEQAKGNGKGVLDEVMAQLLKDAENVIDDVSEEVKQELTDEIAIIRDQFEKKKKQIMEKARKNANNKTSTITDKIKETLANTIDQMSTSKITEAFEHANHQLEDLVQLSSNSTPKVIGERSADNKLNGQTNAPQANEKRVVEINNRDEIEISAIEVDNKTESKENFEDWFTQ
jgi:hypothetical protein